MILNQLLILSVNLFLPGKLPTNYETVSLKIYGKLAYRGSSEGIIGVYKTNEKELENYFPTENAAVIVIESVEKPGNLGAILRSCEAFGIEALIITDTKVDLFNPNVIRSSVGCLFGMTIFQSDNEMTSKFLNENNFQIFTTNMHHNAVEISKKNFTKKSALVFGTEHSGLSDFWTPIGENINIPMSGTIDSLNLSNAVAISCYEILRQKKIN
ncbi:TrmH family RNA methyltransferase [Halpernia sp. GG3]